MRHQEDAAMVSMGGTLNYYTEYLVLSSFFVIIFMILLLALFFACAYVYQKTRRVRQPDTFVHLQRPPGRKDSVVSPVIRRFLHYGLPAVYHWKTGVILSILWILFLFPGVWLLPGNPGETLMDLYPLLFLVSILLGFLDAHLLTFRLLDALFGEQYFPVISRRVLLFTISIAGLMAGTGVLFFFDALLSAIGGNTSFISGESISLFAFFVSALFIGITPFSLTYEITCRHRDIFMV